VKGGATLFPCWFAPDIDYLIALVVKISAENDHLGDLLKTANSLVFGARSERGVVVLADQGIRELGDRETNVVEAANDDEPSADAPVRKRARRNIGALLKHLKKRVERIIEPEAKDRPCCTGALHRIGEDASEAFDWVSAILRVICMVRPKYACRQCQGAIVQAPAPRRMISCQNGARFAVSSRRILEME